MVARYLKLLAFVLISSTATAGPLKIGTVDDYHGYSYIEKGVLKGANVEIVRLVLEKIGYEPTILPLPWSRLKREARDQRLDGWMGILKTRERQAFLFFPEEPLSFVEMHIALPAASPISFDGDFSSFIGRRVGVVVDWDFLLKKIDWQGVDRILFDNQARMLLNVASARIHAGIGIRKDMLAALRKNGSENTVRILPTPVLRKPEYIAFTKNAGGKRLARDFSMALRQFKTTELHRKIQEKYGLSAE